jgi:hypothetical protein
MALRADSEGIEQEELPPAETIQAMTDSLLDPNQAAEVVIGALRDLCRTFRSGYVIFVPEDLLARLAAMVPSPNVLELIGVVIGRRPDLVTNWNSMAMYLLDMLSAFEDTTLLWQFLDDAKWNSELRSFFLSFVIQRADEALPFLVKDNALEGRLVLASQEDPVGLVSNLIDGADELKALLFMRRMAEDALHDRILDVVFDFWGSWLQAVNDGDAEVLTEISGICKASCVSAEAARRVMVMVPVKKTLAMVGSVSFGLWEPVSELWRVLLVFFDPQ